MEPTHVKATRYGSVSLEPGVRYKVISKFLDYDAKLHEPGEEWVFRGYDIFPYEDGHTLFVGLDSGEEDVIRLRWHLEEQAHVLESFEDYVTVAQQAFPANARA